MGRGIIQTAVNNKTLRLELEYRQPSMLREGNAMLDGRTTETGLAHQYDGPRVADESACLLSVI